MTNDGEEINYDSIGAIIKYLMMQHGVKQHSITLDKESKDASKKEFMQIANLEAFQPLDTTHLTAKEKRSSIEFFQFLTKQRNNIIKDKTYVNGIKQQAITTEK